MSSSSLRSNFSRTVQTAVSLVFRARDTMHQTFVLVGDARRSLAAATIVGDKARYALDASHSIASLFDETKGNNFARSSATPTLAKPRKLAINWPLFEVSVER